MRQRTINSKTKMAAAVERVATSAKRKKAADLLAAHLRNPDNVPEPRLPEDRPLHRGRHPGDPNGRFRRPARLR